MKSFVAVVVFTGIGMVASNHVEFMGPMDFYLGMICMLTTLMFIGLTSHARKELPNLSLQGLHLFRNQYLGPPALTLFMVGSVSVGVMRLGSGSILSPVLLLFVFLWLDSTYIYVLYRKRKKQAREEDGR